MGLEGQAFQSRHLEGDGFWKDDDKESLPMSLRINKAEREKLERLKNILHIHQDSKVLKLGLDVLENVILGTFGARNLKYIASQSRRKLTDESFEDKPKI